MLFGTAGAAQPAGEQRVRSLVVQNELIMHVPVRTPSGQFQWIKYEGPKCINARAIRGALLSGSDSVDFITVRRRRFRAELSQDCPALDFYGGFYLKPEDTRICAKRDVIRSRMGGSCRIERFQQLIRKPKG